MAIIEKQILTPEQIRLGVKIENDPFSIGEKCLTKGRINTILSNPNLTDDTEPMVIFTLVDGNIWGRNMWFPSKLRIDGKVVDCLGGSSLLVCEEGRRFALGVDILMYPMQNRWKDYILYAAASKMAYPLFQKLRYAIFEFPCSWQIRNAKSIFQSLGFKGMGLTIITNIVNFFLNIINGIVNAFLRCSIKKFEVKQIEEVPDWIIQIVENDKHKYAEYHDKRWFEWVLTNNFYEREKNSKKLYGIYKDETPVGFILLKERQGAIEEKNIDSVVFGSVIEWGINDSGLIDEYIVNKIALSLFSKNVDIAQVISSDEVVVDRFRKFFMFRHGSTNIVFKDLTKQLDKDYKDPQNWRLRTGCSDVPFC